MSKSPSKSTSKSTPKSTSTSTSTSKSLDGLAKERRKSAVELLALEKRIARGPLDAESERQWASLATRVFGDGYGSRKSFRLPVSNRVTLRIRKGTLDCKLRSLSQVAFSAAAPVLAYVGIDEPVEVESVEVDGKTEVLHLETKVLKVVTGESDVPTCAFGVIPGQPAKKLQDYFDKFYYPEYLRYLESLTR